MHIYLITNLVNGKQYVGKTLGSIAHRWGQHKAASRRQCITSRLYNAMRKHGIESFIIEPLCSEFTTNEELCRWERELITGFKTNDPQFGYNIEDGGPGGARSDEVRAKLSLTTKRNWAKSLFRQKAIAGMKGHKFSDEHKASLAAAKRGKPSGRKGAKLTQSHRDALKAAWIHRKQRIESGEEIHWTQRNK